MQTVKKSFSTENKTKQNKRVAVGLWANIPKIFMEKYGKILNIFSIIISLKETSAL